MCRCYHCRWGQPYYTNGGYWHKCICFTCRTVGSRGTTEMNIYTLKEQAEHWPRCSRCNQNLVMTGPNFKAPKYNDKKTWNYLKNNWKDIFTIDKLKKYIKEVEIEKKQKALKTERYYNWSSHKYEYRIPILSNPR